MPQAALDGPPFGLLNLNKPSGITSHDVVNIVRRGSGERRVGHAGTLDPLASGVLLLALGKATRLLEYLTASTKRYRATIKLGTTTDTYDVEGRVLQQRPLPDGLTLDDVREILQRDFSGTIQQMPPIYSALKVDGKPAYQRARAGEQVTLQARPVTLYSVEVVSAEWPYLTLDVHCGPGTYIRSLAHDLGQTLGCGATLSALTRLASGDFHIDAALSTDALQTAFDDGSWRQHLLPADLALDGTPQVHLDEDGFKRLRNGMTLPAENVSGLARAYAPDGRFVAVLVGDPQRNHWQPKKVFA